MQKELGSQGYYCDMVSGYISRAGGGPRMVYYPKELQKLQTCCPYCHESSGLNIPQMILLLDEERENFKSHTDEIISTRKANGDRDPYPSKENVEGKRSDSSATRILQRYFKRNLVSPSKRLEKSRSRDDIQEKDEFYFDLDVNKLIVCQCMVAKANEIEVEDPEGDNESCGEDVATIVRYQKKEVNGDVSHTENESDESIDLSDQDEMDLQRVHSA